MEWGKLRARYGSNSQYARRQVLKSQGDIEQFKEWISSQGADVLATKMQAESFRFYLNNKLGIMYEKGSGNLLAHDLGIKFYKQQG